MARASTKSRKRATPPARRPASSAEDLMFFPRLRRKAKWVFAALAVAFAFSFVVAGVGSGFGSGIGDYLSELFNRQPGADTDDAIEDARARVEENPRDAAAQLELADALSANGQVPEAIAALEAYVELDASNEEALQQLAGLYLIEANEADQRAAQARDASGVAFFNLELYGDQLGEAFGAGPFVEQQQQRASEVYSNAAVAAQNFHAQEAEVWEKLVALRPEDSGYLLELARANQQANDLPGAIDAYQRYLAVAPEDDPTAEEVKRLVDQLKVAQAGSNPTPPEGGGGGGGGG
jgi:cytochrome c-type biogenesis protein CcmH/NrfG